VEPLIPLGHDFLKFLGAFVIITPLFKRINVSPILGFLLAGVLLRQAKCVQSLIVLLLRSSAFGRYMYVDPSPIK
jgi:Kef-type K+ transport system membrane component KefB